MYKKEYMLSHLIVSLQELGMRERFFTPENTLKIPNFYFLYARDSRCVKLYFVPKDINFNITLKC